MTVHAFVDESCRKGRYLVAAIVVDPGDLARLRKLLRGLLLPGQRELHFKKEQPARRRKIISELVLAGVHTHVYLRSCIRGMEAARQACLARLAGDLLAVEARRVVLDSREERDRIDEQTFRTVLGKHPRVTGLTYEHVASTQEQLLWAPDVVAWCYGAGGDWRRRIMPAIATAINLDVEA